MPQRPLGAAARSSLHYCGLNSSRVRAHAQHIVKLLAKRGANVLSVDLDGLVPRDHTSNRAIHEVLDSTVQKNPTRFRAMHLELEQRRSAAGLRRALRCASLRGLCRLCRLCCPALRCATAWAQSNRARGRSTGWRTNW
jgi:hypothetical protein